MVEEKNPWKTVSKTEMYDNPWVNITHRDVITPNDTKGIYGVVHFKNLAVGVIPLDENYNTWIVGQYRYTLEEYSWEIPEGGCPMNEEPIEAAKRELAEETGLSAEKWTKVIELTTSNSVTDERAICFVAQNISLGEANPEDTEQLKIRKLPFDELFQMAMEGKIHDAMSLCTIFKVKQMIDNNIL